MTDQPVTRSARRLLLAVLALTVVAGAVPLALERAAVVADAQRAPWAWSASQAWAAVVLGGVAGLLVALLLRARWRRLAPALGVAIALAGAGFGAYRALPAVALDVPGCGAVAPAAPGEWQLAARTLVDGDLRDSLSVRIQPISRTGEQLLADVLAELEVAASEDVGIDLIYSGSLYARHCRALVSGSQATRALPLLANGAGVGQPLVPAALPIWRGQLDWWVSADNQLVGARIAVSGHPADAWPVDALRGELLVELWPTAR